MYRNVLFSATALSLVLMTIPLTAGAALIVDRGLPNINLNNAAGSERSNVAWGSAGFENNPITYGDDFRLPDTPKYYAWQIDRITTWAIAGTPDGSFALGNRYDEISLFLGLAGDEQGTEIPLVLNANLTGNTTDNDDVTITPVTYADGSNYEVSSGNFLQIWQIDWFNVGVFGAGQYMFGVNGVGVDDPIWFDHASNAALSGTPQQDADNLYRDFDVLSNTLAFWDFIDSDGRGWDKSSDINIQVYGTTVYVPEPGSLALFALGLGGLLVGLRRRGQLAA